MHSNLVRCLLLFFMSVCALHISPSQAGVVVSKRQANDAHTTRLPSGWKSGFRPSQAHQKDVTGKAISARQYKHHGGNIGDGWDFHYNEYGNYFPQEAAAAAMINLWSLIRIRTHQWASASVPDPGPFAFAFGDMRVHFQTVGGPDVTIPWWLVGALSEMMLGWALAGSAGLFDVMFSRGDAAVHVWVEVLAGAGD